MSFVRPPSCFKKFVHASAKLSCELLVSPRHTVLCCFSKWTLVAKANALMVALMVTSAGTVVMSIRLSLGSVVCCIVCAYPFLSFSYFCQRFAHQLSVIVLSAFLPAAPSSTFYHVKWFSEVIAPVAAVWDDGKTNRFICFANCLLHILNMTSSCFPIWILVCSFCTGPQLFILYWFHLDLARVISSWMIFQRVEVTFDFFLLDMLLLQQGNQTWIVHGPLSSLPLWYPSCYDLWSFS